MPAAAGTLGRTAGRRHRRCRSVRPGKGAAQVEGDIFEAALSGEEYGGRDDEEVESEGGVEEGERCCSIRCVNCILTESRS